MGLLVLGVLGFNFLQKRLPSFGTGFLYAWVLVASASLLLHGKFDSMHYVPFLAPLAVLTASMLAPLWGIARSRGNIASFLVLSVVALSIVVPLKKLAGHVLYARQALLSPASVEAGPGLASYLRNHTSPTDRIFVWGNSPAIYFYARRKSSSRFIHTYFLSLPWRTVDFHQTLLAEITTNRPRYFVLMKFLKPAEVETLVRFQCPPEEIDLQGAYENFSALRRLVDAEYQLDQDTEAYSVFVRR